LIIDKLKELDLTLDHLGIRLILLIPPHRPIHLKLNDEEELENIYMGDGCDFPEYFRVVYRYNLGHSKNIGVEVCTKRFSQQFNELTH